MAITRVSFIDMPKEVWIERRRKTIGGSDAGTILGFNPYQSSYTLWAIKTGRLTPEDISDKESVRLGHDLEQYVADRWTEATGKKLRKDNNFVYNDEYPFAHVQADRLVVGERAGFEAKTTSDYRKLQKLQNGDFDDIWYAQCVHGMAVTGLDKWYLGVLVFGRGFYHFEIERDQKEIDALMQAEKEFWTEYVEKNVPPAPDGSDSTTDTVAALYPDSDGSECDLTAYEQWLEERMILDHQINDLKRLKDEADNRVKDYMMASVRGESPHYKVSWCEQVRSTFDKTSFQIDHPEIDLAKYYNKTKSRVFKVTMKKEK